MRAVKVVVAVLALSYALFVMTALPASVQQGRPAGLLLGHGASALVALLAALLLFRSAYRRK
jgi:hypothetical protein